MNEPHRPASTERPSPRSGSAGRITLPALEATGFYVEWAMVSAAVDSKPGQPRNISEGTWNSKFA
ncbi:MAG TPA: hypothetical protein VFV09_07055 [Actinomycetota bacterium]|nr:hypothetical protein [Actinomycetota bacterium]